MMKVKEILAKKSAQVITITPEQSLYEASQLLAEHNIGAVVVVDSHNTPIGILSERDIVRKLSTLKAEVVNQRVQDAMTKDIIIGFPEDDLANVSNVMTEKRIRHLPIMDEHQLIGIISIGDVVKSQLKSYKMEVHTLQQYITGGYS